MSSESNVSQLVSVFSRSGRVYLPSLQAAKQIFIDGHTDTEGNSFFGIYQTGEISSLKITSLFYMRTRKNCGIQCHVARRLISITYLPRLTGQSQRAKKQCRHYHGARDISRNNSIHSHSIPIPNIKYRRQSETAWETTLSLSKYQEVVPSCFPSIRKMCLSVKL